MIYKLFLFFWILSPLSCKTSSEKSLSKKQKELIDTQLSLVKTYLNTGSTENAINLIRPIFQLHENYPGVRAYAGLAYLTIGNTSKATRIFSKEYLQRPSTANGLNLSSALLSGKKFNAARNLLKKIHKDKTYKYPERILHNFALSYEKEKKWRKAIFYYTKAVKEHPTYYLSRFRLGLAQKKMKQLRKAHKTFKKSSKLCKACIEPIQELVKIYIQNRKFSLAMKSLTQYLGQKELSKKERLQGARLLKMTQKYKSKKQNHL